LFQTVTFTPLTDMSNLTTLTPTAEAVTVQLSTPVTPTTPVAASVDPGCIFESKDTLVKS